MVKENLDIEQVKKLKAQLEDDILDLVSKFNNRTGAFVYNIDLLSHEVSWCGDKVVYAVKAIVEI